MLLPSSWLGRGIQGRFRPRTKPRYFKLRGDGFENLQKNMVFSSFFEGSVVKALGRLGGAGGCLGILWEGLGRLWGGFLLKTP